jgi:hypothetical protein
MLQVGWCLAGTLCALRAHFVMLWRRQLKDTTLFTFACYGCLLFEDRRRTPADAPPGSTDELLIAWVFSAVQRFILHEPTLILAAKGLPILFATECCANCCGESIVNLLSILFGVILEAIKMIKS